MTAFAHASAESESPGAELVVWLLPDQGPVASCSARRAGDVKRAIVPRDQDQLVLDPGSLPPDGRAADTHHNRALWFATPPAGLPDPRRFAGSLTQAVAEVLVGRRPAAQLVRWVAEEALAALNWQLRTAVRGRRNGSTNPPAVCSVHIQLPAPGVVEVAAHLRGDEVPPALALRLEARTQRWFCTALEWGPEVSAAPA